MVEVEQELGPPAFTPRASTMPPEGNVDAARAWLTTVQKSCEVHDDPQYALASMTELEDVMVLHPVEDVQMAISPSVLCANTLACRMNKRLATRR